MSDLVERLHTNAIDCTDDARWAIPELAPLLHEAADEIASLRAQLAEEKAKHALTIQHADQFRVGTGPDGSDVDELANAKAAATHWRDKAEAARKALEEVYQCWQKSDNFLPGHRIDRQAMAALSDDLRGETSCRFPACGCEVNARCPEAKERAANVLSTLSSAQDKP